MCFRTATFFFIFRLFSNFRIFGFSLRNVRQAASLLGLFGGLSLVGAVLGKHSSAPAAVFGKHSAHAAAGLKGECPRAVAAAAMSVTRAGVRQVGANWLLVGMLNEASRSFRGLSPSPFLGSETEERALAPLARPATTTLDVPRAACAVHRYWKHSQLSWIDWLHF